MSFSIRSRLTMWYVLLLAAILIAWSGFLIIRLNGDLYAGIDRTLASRAAQISLGLQGRGEGEFQDISDAAAIHVPRGESIAQLLSAHGKVLESSGDGEVTEPIVSGSSLTKIIGGQTVFQTVSLGKKREKFRVLVVKLSGRSNVIAVGTSTEEADNSIHSLIIWLLISGPAALIAAGAGGWLLARKALLPVSRMTVKASKIGVGQLSERLEVPPTTDELSKLAITLNTMLNRVQRGVEEKHRFIADASHELRTPLAVMRSEIDVSLVSEELPPEAIAVLESAREEVDRMTRIVENLLTLARIDEGRLQILRKPTNIKKLAEAVSSNMYFLANTKDVRISVEGTGGLADADPEYLEQVVTNLLENAVKYSSPGGSVKIDVWQTGDEIGLTVSDEGPGIAPESLTRVFDRFFRVDPARSRREEGSGLGLSISQEIMEAHNGRIWATSDIGKGSSFSIALPASA